MQAIRDVRFFVLWLIAMGVIPISGFGAHIAPIKEPTGKNLEQAIVEAACVTNGVEMRDAKGLVFYASDFRPDLVDVETGNKLEVAYEATIPYYPVTLEQSTKSGGLVVRAKSGKVVSAPRTGEKARAGHIALVEERYWEEFQRLQKYKELYPETDWCRVPEHLRYKAHEWKQVAAPPEMLREPQNNAMPEITATAPIMPTEKRTSRRTTSSGNSFIPFIHMLLLTPLDTDNDGLGDWWEWTHFGNLLYDDDDHATDYDNVENIVEYQNYSSPTNSDTDADGISDYQEIYVTHTQPSLSDSDFDGLKDNNDPYPTTYAPYLFGEIITSVANYERNDLPPNQWGWVNPVFIANVPIDIFGLPAGAVVIETMLCGFIDDAIKANNLPVKWTPEALTIGWTNVPSSAVNPQTGAFTLQLYDWIPSNYNNINNNAALKDIYVKTKYYILLQVDLEIYDGQAGPIVTEADEETKGAFTVANLNDTDNDGTDDQSDSNVSGELDLMKLVLKKPVPDLGGQVSLTVPANAKLWKSSDKVAGEETRTTINVGALPITLWAEARQGSTALRDFVFELEYHGCKDIVKATAIWSATPNVRTTQNADYTTANSKRASQWLLGASGGRVDKLGLQKTGTADGDWFSGNMECVYALLPNAHIPGMQWRSRRYVKRNYWVNLNVQPNFPSTDWENDSQSTWCDYDQDPDVYDIDCPGFKVLYPDTSYSMKGNFKQHLEVRVHASGTWSRCSPYGYWKYGRRARYYGTSWLDDPPGANFIAPGQIPGEPATWPPN